MKFYVGCEIDGYGEKWAEIVAEFDTMEAAKQFAEEAHELYGSYYFVEFSAEEV